MAKNSRHQKSFDEDEYDEEVFEEYIFSKSNDFVFGMVFFVLVVAFVWLSISLSPKGYRMEYTTAVGVFLIPLLVSIFCFWKVGAVSRALSIFIAREVSNPKLLFSIIFIGSFLVISAFLIVNALGWREYERRLSEIARKVSEFDARKNASLENIQRLQEKVDGQKAELKPLVNQYCAGEYRQMEQMRALYSGNPAAGLGDMVKHSNDQWVSCIRRLERAKGFNPYKLEEDIVSLKQKHKIEYSFAERSKISDN